MLVGGFPGEKIHTSYSKPIGPGLVFGTFRTGRSVVPGLRSVNLGS